MGGSVTEKECYAILEIAQGSDLALVKRAYRRLAFSLHPDLNPGLPGAARRFQLLNEAYVSLTKTYDAKAAGKPGAGGEAGAGGGAKAAEQTASEKQRQEAEKAYAKAKAQQGSGRKTATGGEDGGPHRRTTDSDASAGAKPNRRADDATPPNPEEVLKDILDDPFARRVFEDIYARVRKEGKANRTTVAEPETATQGSRPSPRSQARAKKGTTQAAPAVVGKLKDWMRKQIDDEQVLRLPGEHIIPGARVRLQIVHGLGGTPQTVEVTLPYDFAPGKTMRLKGLGKRIGRWSGDLYVTVEPE